MFPFLNFIIKTRILENLFLLCFYDNARHMHVQTQAQLIPCHQKKIVLYLRQNKKQVLTCNFFGKRVRVTGLTENGCKIVQSITKQLPMYTFVSLQLLPFCNDCTCLITQITKKKHLSYDITANTHHMKQRM